MHPSFVDIIAVVCVAAASVRVLVAIPVHRIIGNIHHKLAHWRSCHAAAVTVEGLNAIWNVTNHHGLVVHGEVGGT